MRNNKTTLVMVAAVIVTGGAVAFGQGTWSNSSQSIVPNNQSRSATAAGQPGYIEPSTGYINSGVPTNGAYLPPFGSPNSANGAPQGAVGNTGANQVPGVVNGGRTQNQSFNATGGTNPAGTVSGSTTSGSMGSPGSIPSVNSAPIVSSGSPQAAGALNSAPNGAAGTYGYPNGVDPNGALNNSGATFKNTEAGRATTSGTTGSINSVPFGSNNGSVAPGSAAAPR